jgi:hypothetical protein
MAAETALNEGRDGELAKLRLLVAYCQRLHQSESNRAQTLRKQGVGVFNDGNAGKEYSLQPEWEGAERSAAKWKLFAEGAEFGLAEATGRRSSAERRASHIKEDNRMTAEKCSSEPTDQTQRIRSNAVNAWASTPAVRAYFNQDLEAFVAHRVAAFNLWKQGGLS